MPDKDNNSETASVDAEAGNDTKVEKQKGIVIKADEGDDKSNENEDSKLSDADEADAKTKELSAKRSPLKPKTKEFLDKEEKQSDDDAETTGPEKSHKIKTTDEDDSDKDEKKEKSPQKSVKKKTTAKENSSDDSKQEKSSKSQKRKAPVEEDSDADSKNKDDEEEEPKVKSRKRADSEEKEEDDEGSEDEEEELKPGLLEQPVVLEEGLKREKKKVQRLELTPPSASKDKKIDIPEGSGEKLGDIPRIEFQLSKTVSDDLRALHRVLYQRAGTAGEVKKNIRRFSGFTFAKNSAAYKQKVTQLNKMNTACLKSICEVLDLERGGKKEDILDRLINFLMKPKSSGKALPKKKRSSTGEKSSRKSKTPKKKTEKRKSRKKKSSSEDEEDTEEHDDEEEEKEEEEEPEEEPEEEEEEKEESSDEDFNAKKRKTPKKATPAKKASKKSSSAEENKSKRAAKDEKTKKKTPVSKKRPRDSDSEEGSDEEPLKKQKTEPTNEELKDVVKKILEGANLEEVTMKTVYKQVFEKYPDFDLSSRKEFIKGAVKQIIR